ncbi:O-antigen ligase family protein [Amphritea sp.]|uniref:O-antigen ligase family protein n=1 Tax=Amphritea sp. TaxID=1872502 RepID=UPI0025C112CA|nr:O-antigen ligase family protein [Amphritea sp.]
MENSKNIYGLRSVDYKRVILWGILLTIPLYLVANELAKGLLVVFGIIALFAVIYSPIRNFKSLNGSELLLCFSLLFFPLCFAISYWNFGAPRDYELSIEFSRVSLLIVVLFMSIKRVNDLGFDTVKISISAFGILSGLAGLWYFIGDGRRVTVGTDLINMYGAIMSCSAGLAFYYLFKELKIRLMVLFFIAGFLSLIGVMTSGSKIAIIAAVSVLLINMVLVARTRKRLLLIVLLPTIAIMILIGPVNRFVEMLSVITEQTAYQQADENQKLKRSSDLPRTVDASVGVRVQMYMAAIEAIKEKPLLGHGSWRFKDLFPDELMSGELLLESRRFTHVHNEILQAWMARGLPGLLSLVLLLATPILVARGASSDIKVSVWVVVYTFSLVGMFEAPFNANVSYVFYLLLLTLILSFNIKRQPAAVGES